MIRSACVFHNSYEMNFLCYFHLILANILIFETPCISDILLTPKKTENFPRLESGKKKFKFL